MKKLLASIMAAMIALASICAAEEPIFKLENGLSWNMTADETLAALGITDAYREPFYEGVDMVQCTLETDIPDDDCAVTVSMLFVDNGLAMIMYDFLRMDDGQVKQDCIDRLTAVYGEPIEGGMNRFMSSIGLLAGLPELTAEDIGAAGTGCSWELADGTYFGVYDMTDISFGVYFVNEPLFAKVADYAVAAMTISYDELPEPSENDFSVRDFALMAPVYMGMEPETLENVAALEGYKYYEYETGNNATLYNTLVYSSGNYDVQYGFRDGVLTVQALRGLLFEPCDMCALITSLYGEPEYTDAETLFALLTSSGFNSYSSVQDMTDMGFTGDITWTLEDGTFIILTQSDAFDNFSLYFVKPAESFDISKEISEFTEIFPGIWTLSIDDIHAEKRANGFTCATTDREGAVSLSAYKELAAATIYENYLVYPRGFVAVSLGIEAPGAEPAAAATLSSLYGTNAAVSEDEAFVIEAVTGADDGTLLPVRRMPDGGIAVLLTEDGSPDKAAIYFINPEHLPTDTKGD